MSSYSFIFSVFLRFLFASVFFEGIIVVQKCCCYNTNDKGVLLGGNELLATLQYCLDRKNCTTAYQLVDCFEQFSGNAAQYV